MQRVAAYPRLVRRSPVLGVIIAAHIGVATVVIDLIDLTPRRLEPQPTPPEPLVPQAIRMNQEGLVRIAACVQPDGRLARIDVGRSSGYPLLDAAAVKHLSRASVRLQPGTRNGEPVETCTEIPVRFEIENR
jgi:TonB family protein